jgi:hypothetical protein
MSTLEYAPHTFLPETRGKLDPKLRAQVLAKMAFKSTVGRASEARQAKAAQQEALEQQLHLTQERAKGIMNPLVRDVLTYKALKSPENHIKASYTSAEGKQVSIENIPNQVHQAKNGSEMKPHPETDWWKVVTSAGGKESTTLFKLYPEAAKLEPEFATEIDAKHASLNQLEVAQDAQLTAELADGLELFADGLKRKANHEAVDLSIDPVSSEEQLAELKQFPKRPSGDVNSLPKAA